VIIKTQLPYKYYYLKITITILLKYSLLPICATKIYGIWKIAKRLNDMLLKLPFSKRGVDYLLAAMEIKISSQITEFQLKYKR